LIAGSTGWSNYRHQSSVYKAYHIAHDAGIPDERIITFFEDDLANNYENPFPGKVFNEIYVEGGNNINVYEGVVKDYIAEDASLDNLMSVLTGETPSSGSGKTLGSTSKDNVFIFYDDHGNSGIIALPTDEIFYDHHLTKVLNTLASKKMYKNLIFFMSACYSGSMFYKQELPENVYAATSAPTDASSYACLDDPTLGTYLSSCWPHGWINSLNTKGLDTDFGTIFEDSYNYAMSQPPPHTAPCQYGDLSLKNITFLEFMKNKPIHGNKKTDSSMPFVYDDTAVPQYLVPYAHAKKMYERKPTELNYAKFKAETEIRNRVDRMVNEIINQVLPTDKALYTPVCEMCDRSCPCYANCMRTGSSDHCARMCCDYSACTAADSKDEEQIECSLTLQRAFTDAIMSSDPTLGKHPYIVAAGKQWNRLCRSGVDVAKTLQAINRVCH